MGSSLSTRLLVYSSTACKITHFSVSSQIMGRGAQKKQTLQSAAIMRKRHWECLLDLVLSYLFYACVCIWYLFIVSLIYEIHFLLFCFVILGFLCGCTSYVRM